MSNDDKHDGCWNKQIERDNALYDTQCVTYYVPF